MPMLSSNIFNYFTPFAIFGLKAFLPEKEEAKKDDTMQLTSSYQVQRYIYSAGVTKNIDVYLTYL